MQENARYQAVLELLEKIFEDKQPADNIINDYLRERKYIGSKDRRFISETVWEIIRRRLKLEFDAGSSYPRKILMTYLGREASEKVFNGEKYAPAALSAQEKKELLSVNEEVYPAHVEAECPQWLFDKIGDSALLKSLNNPAPADFRINVPNRKAVIEAMHGEGLDVRPTPYSPLGLRTRERINLNNCMAYQEGKIEVQDEASQLAAILADVKPECKIMDYCCGAGGKSLAMAFLIGGKGKILAHDISRKRLLAMRPRMERLGLKNIELVEIVATSDKDFDRFVVDAPCTGTGTWRRAPDAKFRLTPQHLTALTQTQSEILDIAYSKTKIGGRIIYITCSILREENEDIVEAFLKKYPDMKTIDMEELWKHKIEMPYPHSDSRFLRLNPLNAGTDGFFVSVMEKKTISQ